MKVNSKQTLVTYTFKLSFSLIKIQSDRENIFGLHLYSFVHFMFGKYFKILYMELCQINLEWVRNDLCYMERFWNCVHRMGLEYLCPIWLLN